MTNRRFLCDEMLAGLARWLRAAGYDAATGAAGQNDRALVERAVAEDRLLLTRDHALPRIKGAFDHTLVLDGTDLDDWAAELRGRLRLDWRAAPMTRCLVCNVELTDADGAARAHIPDGARAGPGPFRACPACGRAYWPGGHVQRMLKRLARFAGHPEAEEP
ncbi:MAG: hypothetical protein HQL36_05860 [Alphaproteobacteria bacterium]|nr:hypothetical protein [Alphaproteobacteria bacterium]MBF0250573.1 hypothetical protein [Alphaproteobacteria bacterium]